MATNMASTASHPQNTNLFFRFRQANLPTAARKTASRKTPTQENVSSGMAYFPNLAVRSLQGAGITLALAEKVSAMRTEEYFEEGARRTDPARVNRILARVGKGNPPIQGDELPLEFAARNVKKKKRRETSLSLGRS